MSKRPLEEINVILEKIDKLEDIEEVLESVEKKRRLEKIKRYSLEKKEFIDTRGYFVSKDKDPAFDNDVDIIRCELSVTVNLQTWNENDPCVDVTSVTSDDELFAVLKLNASAELEKMFDPDSLDLSAVEFDRDDYRDPLSGSLECKIYVYVKRQSAPSTEKTSVKLYRDQKVVVCSNRNNALIDSDNVTVVEMKDWPAAYLFDVDKLRVTEPYAL